MKRVQASTPPRTGAAGGRRFPWRPAGLVPFLLFLAFLGACLSVPIDRRARDLHNQPPPRSLPVPVDRASKSALRDSFGDPRSGGRRHEGIDIFAPRNTPVLSATEGYVIGVSRNGLGGNVVSVEGPAGWRHYYAHLERWGNVRQGQWVEAGTILGYVGNSGNAASAPTHLHYGIYPRSGGAINPYPLLVRGPGPVMARHPTPGTGPAPAPTGRDHPTDVETETRRRTRNLGVRVLREVLEAAGGNN